MEKSKRILRRSKLAKAVEFLSKKDPGLIVEIEKDLSRLLQENDLSNKVLARHLKNSILPSLAFYRSLIRAGWKKEEAFALVEETVLEDAKQSVGFFQRLVKLPFGYRLFCKLCVFSMKHVYVDVGWDFRWKSHTKETLAWDCHKCLYFDVFQRYDATELTDIFCRCDDLVYGSLPGIIWERTQTLGRGDSVCDFKFRVEKKKSK